MNNNIIKFKRITFLLTLSALVFGFYSAYQMPKSEDPLIAKTAGMVTIVYPGASPNEISQFVVKPLQDELSEVNLIEEVKVTVRTEVAIVTIRLDRDLSSEPLITKAWDETRRAIARAEKSFPESVIKPVLNDNILEKESIVYAATSDKYSIIELKDALEEIREKVLQFKSVKKVIINSDPGKQISINIEDEIFSKLGLNYFQISEQLKKSNLSIPAGSLRFKKDNLLLSTNSTFKFLDEIKNFPIVLNSGQIIKLKEFAEIKTDISLPQKVAMMFNGNDSLGLGIVLDDEIDLIKYGSYFEEKFSELSKLYPELTFNKVSYFPENVKTRILDLSQSLLIGIMSLGVVLMIFMGVRVGALVAIIVPLITLISLGVFSQMGGILQQISISAFVMALGLLVDNVIVISESIQTKMNNGISALESSKMTIDEFALPLFAATGTTVAAFIPMMLAPGPAGQFTRSLATVTSITLTVSFIFSIFVTPLLTAKFLKPRKKMNSKLLTNFSNYLSDKQSKHSGKLMIFVLMLLALGMMTIPMLKVQFFPYADRDQLVIDLRLPDGTHFDVTHERAKSIVRKIMRSNLWKNEIVQIASYTGNSTPKFFYNLNLIPNSPHIAQMIVRVRDFSIAPKVRDQLDNLLSPLVLDGTLIVRELEQGPPVEAAVVVKVFSEDQSVRQKTTFEIFKKLKEINSTKNVRHSLGVGTPKLNFIISDANAQQYGVTRSEVSSIILGRSRGIYSGDFRIDDKKAPILIRSKEGESFDIDKIGDSFVRDSRSRKITINDIAYSNLEFVPSSLLYENGRSLTKILIETSKGYGYGDILNELNPFLAKFNTEAEIELDGQAEESNKSNKQLIAGAPYALVALTLFLLIQFNSYKKFFIVFSAVPLSFIGIGPSHLLFGFPFGFFSLLGALALIGIIVNNAILLIEFIDLKLSEKNDIEYAINETLKERLRPIFLTTLTTVIGLMPLCFSDATLWPPFGWTIVFGLILGSSLTVVFVPCLYKFLIYDRSHSFKSLILPFLILGASNSYAKQMTISEVLELSKKSASANIADIELERAIEQKDLQFKSTFYPSLGLKVEREFLDRQLELETPIGSLPFIPEQRTVGAIVLNQKLIDLKKMIYEREKVNIGFKAKKLQRDRLLEVARFNSALIYLKTLEIEIKVSSLKRYVGNLRKRRREISRLYKLGRVSEIDVLRIKTAIDDTKISLLELESQVIPMRLAIAKSIGESSAVIPTSIKNISSFVVPKMNTETRKDVKALDLKIKSLEYSLKEINAGYLPTLDFEAKSFFQDPSQFQTENWSSISLVLKWDLFERGVRNSNKTIELSKLNQTKIERSDLIRKIEIEKLKYFQLMKVHKKSIALRENNYNSVKKAAKLEVKRYLDGKSSLNDLIDAEILLKEMMEKAQMSRVLYLNSYFQYEFSL